MKVSSLLAPRLAHTHLNTDAVVIRLCCDVSARRVCSI